MDIRNQHEARRVRGRGSKLAGLPIEPRDVARHFVGPRARLGGSNAKCQFWPSVKSVNEDCFVMGRAKLGPQRRLRRVLLRREIEGDVTRRPSGHALALRLRLRTRRRDNHQSHQQPTRPHSMKTVLHACQILSRHCALARCPTRLF